jgi:hypothetical protein
VLLPLLLVKQSPNSKRQLQLWPQVNRLHLLHLPTGLIIAVTQVTHSRLVSTHRTPINHQRPGVRLKAATRQQRQQELGTGGQLRIYSEVMLKQAAGRIVCRH